MKVINDAGHGGSDPGASGFGQREKDWALEASQYVNKRLNELGIQSTQTRTTDVGLSASERTNIVKASGAKVCLSHHYNAFMGKGEGVETIYSIYSNAELATKIAHAIKDCGQKFRRVFNRKGSNGDYYYMHRLTGSVQTIIIEYGFIDNATDYAKMKSLVYREKMYEAVVKAYCVFAGYNYTLKESDNMSLLRRGDAGSDVRALQEKLNDLGYNAGAVDDFFGPVTEKALKSFQKATGIAVDGIAGPQTFAKITALTRQAIAKKESAIFTLGGKKFKIEEV